MTILTENSGHSLYIDYSMPLKSTLTEQIDLKYSIHDKESFQSSKLSRTSRKIKKLSPTLQKLRSGHKVDVNNMDMSDLDELRDSLHLTKQRIKTYRRVDSSSCYDSDLKESGSYPLQKYLDDRVPVLIQNEFVKHMQSHESSSTGQSTFARNVHGVRAKAA
jgi:hypothetical protein